MSQQQSATQFFSSWFVTATDDFVLFVITPAAALFVLAVVFWSAVRWVRKGAGADVGWTASAVGWDEEGGQWMFLGDIAGRD